MNKRNLFGLTLDELKNIVESLGFPAFVAKQITDWLYKKNAKSIDDMTNISLKNRDLLKESYVIERHKPISAQVSKDGTVKYLFPTKTMPIESVFIPDRERATLCISSQVGCKMGCRFCMTGRQGFQQQLTVAEILNQIQSVPEFDKLTNIVYMGMGEPLDNIEVVLKSLQIITSDYGYAWSPRRITVSTVGHVEGLKRFLSESECHLAFSIHTPFESERLSLVPMEKAFPMREVINIIKQYDFSHQRRVSFEYIMFSGFNDTDKHANALVTLLKDIPCRVNLIRFHKIPDSNLMPATTKTMEYFKTILNNKGVLTTIRSSRGEDIFAACGMLSSIKVEELKAEEQKVEDETKI